MLRNWDTVLHPPYVRVTCKTTVINAEKLIGKYLCSRRENLSYHHGCKKN